MLRQWTASESISKFWLAEANESLVQSSIQIANVFGGGGKFCAELEDKHGGWGKVGHYNNWAPDGEDINQTT